MLNLVRRLRKHLPLLLAAVTLLSVLAWSDLSLPQYISDIVDVGIGNMGYEGAIPADRTQSELTLNSINYILRSGMLMLAVALVGVIANILATLIGTVISSKVAMELRHEVYQKVMSLSGEEMNRFSTASLITRTTNDITQVQTFLQMFFRMMLYAPILSIGAIVMVLQTDVSMSWIIVLGVVGVMVFILIAFWFVMPRFKRAQQLIDNVNRVLRENLTGLSVVRAFDNQEFEEKRFEEVNQTLTKNDRFINNVMSLMMPMIMLMMNITTMLIVYFGAKHIQAGNLQVGEMMQFMTYGMQIMFSFIMISMVSAMIPRSAVSMQRIREVLDTENTILDGSSPEKKITKGVISFERVGYRFANAQNDAVQGIDFEAIPGRTTAIIGSTGSGKSTIINLLMRFFDVTEGAIRIDGTDIRAYSLEELRSSISAVLQKSVLFTGTIEENVLLGRRREAIALPAARSAVETALTVSQSAEFVEQLEDGVKSEVAQGGKNFSGGQKQRLAIARALAKDAPILLFDDSFSALDYKTDRALRRQLKEQFSDKNILIVGQRVSSIMDADHILVMDKGRIVGQGTHKSLMKDCAIYQEIAKSQLSEEELEDE